MWRKALRTFRIFVFFALIGFSSTGLFPEPLNMPSTHVITSPEFPSISTPTLGSGFYVPGNSFFNQKKTSTQPESSSSTAESEKKPEKSVSINQPINSISSKDIQSLKNSGLLTGIYNLTNSNSSGNLELNSLLQTLNGIKASPYQNLQNALSSIAESNFAFYHKRKKHSFIVQKYLFQFAGKRRNFSPDCRQKISKPKRKLRRNFLFSVQKKYQQCF